MSNFSISSTPLGANSEYIQPLSPEEQAAQFRWTERKTKLIVETLKLLPQRQYVADFGCRVGNESAYYRDQALIHEMHGFEISDKPLSYARQLGIKTHVWVSGESPCPVEDNSFDAVIAGDLIEHLIDTDSFLSELVRVVKPNGYLIITIPNLAWWWSRIRLLQGKPPSGIGGVSFLHSKDVAIDCKHLRVNVNSEWLNLFSKYRLECISVTGYNYPKLLRYPFSIVDGILTHFPTMAHSNLFLLRNNN